MEEKQTKQEMTNQTTKKNKQIRTRAILVLIVIFILAIFTYISYRGTYLETIEIGENFKQVFKQNIFYQYATMGINFILLFTAFYMSNRSIKKGLKAFFDEEGDLLLVWRIFSETLSQKTNKHTNKQTNKHPFKFQVQGT